MGHQTRGWTALFALRPLIDAIKSIAESITTLSAFGGMGLGDRAQKARSFPEGYVL